MNSLTTKLAETAVTSGEKKKKLGLVPLAKKVPGGTGAKKVDVVTSLRRLTIPPNQAIHKYDVRILFFYQKFDGSETSFEVSKSTEIGVKKTQDMDKCLKVFKMAARQVPVMQGTSTFYDRQASLYSLNPLTLKGDLNYKFTSGLSDSPRFIRAEFGLKSVAESFQATTNDLKNVVNPCPALADKTLLEALNIIVSMPAIENENVVTINNCIHFLITPGDIKGFREAEINGNFTAVGVSKGIKCLEGTDKTPALYMNTEMKISIFYDNNKTLLEMMQSCPGFTTDLKANSYAGKAIAKKFSGAEFYCDYGASKDDRMIVKVRRFAGSASSSIIEREEGPISVKQYFLEKYKKELRYPNLMLAEGKRGALFPVELLKICENQRLTTEQMNGDLEKKEAVKAGAAFPNDRKTATEQVSKAVGIAAETIGGFIRVNQPQTIKAHVEPPPTIHFAGGEAEFNKNSKFPTDFDKRRGNKYKDAKKLLNWEICYYNEKDQAPEFSQLLVSVMSQNGMEVKAPIISFLRDERNLESVFQKAVASKREMLFFVFYRGVHLHEDIKKYEQKYDLLTQEVTLENAKSVGQKRKTLENIINKTNLKLGGLNYVAATGNASTDARNMSTLVVGFETSRGGGGDWPICVGYAANMLDHPQKFAGGYFYVEKNPDIYGGIIQDALATVFANCKKAGRAAPRELFVYFNGVTEGQYPMINEEYVPKIKAACTALNKDFKPFLTVIATSKSHNERFYLSDGRGISNVEPGTVINNTVVSPVYSEFYLASAAPRKGTAKTAKYTLVHWSKEEGNLGRIETFTNQLCYDHQIVFQPIGLPAPLFIAGRCSQRGAQILTTNGIIHDENGQPDYKRMSKNYGYSEKKLGATRYNA